LNLEQLAISIGKIGSPNRPVVPDADAVGAARDRAAKRIPHRRERWKAVIIKRIDSRIAVAESVALIGVQGVQALAR
jgi:hypothetical protein